jgi:hypothetical protein
VQNKFGKLWNLIQLEAFNQNYKNKPLMAG